MEYQQKYLNNDVRAEISYFRKEGEITQCHVVFHVLSTSENYEYQLTKLHEAYNDFLKSAAGLVPVFNRYFLSDIENQIDKLKEHLTGSDRCAVSIIQQPPLDGSKIGLWVWLMSNVENVEIAENEGLVGFRSEHCTHYFAAEMYETGGNSEEQTRKILERYQKGLEHLGCSLDENCIRTWLFVSDIDNNYAGVVKGRKDNFYTHNLTENTHYIASTGIAGRHTNPKTILMFDAYAVKGLKPEQIEFLYAPEHMSRTSDYGVTFERGVCIDLGNKKQALISGTASIDKKGKVMHDGDVLKQTDRMIENVSALLKEAAMDFTHLSQLIVYLRDMSDYRLVAEKIENEFSQVPKIIVHAPICRPAWLVEMECIALK